MTHIRPVHRASRAVLLAIGLLALAACGGESSQQEPDGEHLLSDQQRALEKSKEMAEAMENAAKERAEQTEAARDN